MLKNIRAAAFVYSTSQGRDAEAAWGYADAMVIVYEAERKRRLRLDEDRQRKEAQDKRSLTQQIRDINGIDE